MKTIKDLGALFRAKYPDAYPDLTDEEIGRAVQAKYPNDYDDFVDVPRALVRQSHEVTKIERVVEAVTDFYKPGRGIFTSWWKRLKSEAGGRFLEALNYEQRLAIENGAMLEKATAEGRARQWELDAFVAQNAEIIEQIKVKDVLSKDAASRGYTLETDQTIKREQAITDIKYNDHERRTKLEFDFNLREKQETVKLALLSKSMTQHQEMMFTQELIDDIYRQIDKIKTETLSKSLKKQMIADRREMIATLKEDRRAKQGRLLQTNYGENL